MELVMGSEFVPDDTDNVIGCLVDIADFYPVPESASAYKIKMHLQPPPIVFAEPEVAPDKDDDYED